MSKVGSVGLFARVDDKIGTCNISENNIGLKLSAYPKREKHVMLAYLNSQYGQILIQRRKSGNVQPKLNVADLRYIPIPKFSDDFSERISSLIAASDTALRDSESLYAFAQSILNDAIHFTPRNPDANTSVVSFSQVFSTGRMDAEYFMPKYDDYGQAIADYPNGNATIRELFGHVKTPCTRKKTSYRYVEIGDIDIGTGTASYNDITTSELPDNAKIMTMAGDILVSKVRPNRGAVAILDDDNLLVSGAFTVLREKTSYRREVLQVLLRSEMYKSWLLRFNVGTSYPVIKDDDVLNLPVPLLPDDIQHKISEHVRKSFALRKESERLIALAVKSVELAVEYDENTAMNLITQEEITS